MLVDDYEKYNNDRQDVVDINTDETVEIAETEPMADDCTSNPFYTRILPFPCEVSGIPVTDIARSMSIRPCWS